MRKSRKMAFLLLVSLVYILAGTPLFGGGDADPSLLSNDMSEITLGVVPLSDTNVELGEDVLLEVSIVNNGEYPHKVDIWFTVDLAGVENDKPVTTPYINRDGAITGSIEQGEEVILRFRARPLDEAQVGAYVFYANVGEHDLNYVQVRDSFKGTISDSGIDQMGPGAPDLQEGWAVSAVWAANDAGRILLAGEDGSMPRTVNMNQNYPNPFNPSTTVEFEVKPRYSGSVPVELSIFNIHGQLVRSLVDEKKSAGFYSVGWDGRDQRGIPVESGIYIFRLKSGDDISLRKGVLSK